VTSFGSFGEPANKRPLPIAWAFFSAHSPDCKTRSEDSADRIGRKSLTTCCVRNPRGGLRRENLISASVLLLPATKAAVSFWEWDIPTSNSLPHDLAAAPDRSLWYAGMSSNTLGRRQRHLPRGACFYRRLAIVAACLGRTTFWLNPQPAVDLWDTARTVRRKLERISPLKVAYLFGKIVFEPAPLSSFQKSTNRTKATASFSKGSLASLEKQHH